MSVDLHRYDGDIFDKSSKLISQHAVASYSFYCKCWEKGIRECNVRLFRDDGEFSDGDIDEVMTELNNLKSWALKELSGSDQEYFITRIEHLQHYLSAECKKDGEKFFYLF